MVFRCNVEHFFNGEWVTVEECENYGWALIDLEDFRMGNPDEKFRIMMFSE